MKVKPMIFNTEMVKAILAGKKTVTRRPAKVDYERGMNGPVVRGRNGEVSVISFAPVAGLCPFGNVGDFIYVRETWREFSNTDECGCSDHCLCPPSGTPLYFATHDDGESKWKPSIHMPRKHSRLTLKVTDVRIERVQDISEEQAEKEGVISNEEYNDRAGEGNLFNCHKCDGFQVHGCIAYGGGVAECDCNACDTAVKRFGLLWDSIYQNWKENPYVWVIEFEVIHKNVDKYLGE